MNTFEEEIDEENSDDSEDETGEELTEDNEIEIISEEDIQENIEGSGDEIGEELTEDDEIEILSEEDIQESMKELDEHDEETPPPDTEEIEELVEQSSTVEEKPEELSKEDLEKQLREYHKNLIEAALYAAGKPLNVEILSTKLEIPKRTVDELLNELAFDYLERDTALIINQVGDSYQMAIKNEYVEKISKFATGGAIAEKYLRTLTIIALKQPILKSMVIKLRGSGAYEHIKYLLDNDLIDAVKKGRSQELTTTDKYAEMFGLPKDKETMKQMMISQLGLGDLDNQQDSDYQADDKEEYSEQNQEEYQEDEQDDIQEVESQE
ncbi:MAG: SMC-Scp complex subunit ScpB [Promethearchaeota archaeon]